MRSVYEDSSLKENSVLSDDNLAEIFVIVQYYLLMSSYS